MWYNLILLKREEHRVPRQLILFLLLLLCAQACTPLPEPTPELVPTGPSLHDEVDALRQELALLRQEVQMLGGRVTSLEPWTTRILQVETLLATTPAKKKSGNAKPTREPTPLQLVSTAHQEARVYPSKEGYFGKSAEQVYTWQPGRVYMIYLTPYYPTLIALPPGEILAMGLNLDKDLYNVENQTVGTEGTAYSAIAVRPKFEKGEIEGFVLTTSGRRYLLSFVISEARAMSAVTFETPAVTREREPEVPRIVPRPQS
jgi:hypothetical protein